MEARMSRDGKLTPEIEKVFVVVRKQKERKV